ncbi:MAG TPA: flagellar protein FlgN [Dehalococcoidia bacterium]|nr:flagellar protein FlgN [Dehalococcoidia bacterium]
MTDRDSGAAVLNLLEEEGRLSRRMLRVAQAKREALLAADTETLAPLVRELEGISERLALLEHDRTAHAAAVAGALPGAPVGWQEVAGRMSPPAAARLQELRAELLESLQELRAVNDGNARLVRQAMDLNERYARLLRRATAPTYEARGKLSATAPRQRAWSA